MPDKVELTRLEKAVMELMEAAREEGMGLNEIRITIESEHVWTNEDNNQRTVWDTDLVVVTHMQDADFVQTLSPTAKKEWTLRDHYVEDWDDGEYVSGHFDGYERLTQS